MFSGISNNSIPKHFSFYLLTFTFFHFPFSFFYFFLLTFTLTPYYSLTNNQPNGKATLPLTGKKVLIIVENLPLPFDRRVWQEATTLKKYGAEVFIISPKMNEYRLSYEKIEGIHIYRHWMPSEGKGIFGYLFEYVCALFSEFRLAVKIYFKHRFDVIHACNPPDLIFLVALPFKLLGVKFLFDHHDINPELYIAKYNRKDLFYKLLLLVEKLTFKTADFSIATNESYKEIAINRGRMSPAKVAVVRSGPNTHRLRIMEPDFRIKEGREILIGYVGVIGPQEGIDHLLEALRILIDEFKYSNFLCIICGDGPVREKMMQYAKELDLDNHVKFTGRIPDDQLLPILNTADICVNPDVWNEMNDKSTMNKVMEYMALAKPIVQYDLKEGKFSAKEASLYAQPNDRKDFAAKIFDLIIKPKKRDSLGTIGRDRVVSKLCWHIEEPKLIKFYNHIFSENSYDSLTAEIIAKDTGSNTIDY